MRTETIKTLMIACMLMLFASVAYAAECAGTFSGPTVNVFPGDEFTLNFFNAEPLSAAGNATLVLPPNASVLTVNPVLNVSPFSAYSWNVSVSVEGNYTFGLMLNSSGVDCDESFGVTADDPVADPSVNIFMNDVGSVVLGQTVTYDVNLTNAGPGIAYNLTGLVYTGSGIAVTPSSFSVSDIGNASGNDTATASYSMTPNTCGVDSFNVQMQNYEDASGEDMGPVFAGDGFTVVGTDLGFVSFLPSATTVVQGGSLTFTANVRNVGTLNASSAIVEMYEGGTLLTNATITDVGIGDSTSVLHGYNVPLGMAPGNYTISAQILSSQECPSSNNNANFNIVVLAGYCGDGIVNNASEVCDGESNCDASCQWKTSGGGGGGSGGVSSIQIVLTEDMPSASVVTKKNDVIRLVYEGKSYTFRFRSIFTDSVKVELVSPNQIENIARGNSSDFDLDRDAEDDVKVTILEISAQQAKIKFSLIGVEEPTGRGPVNVLDFPPPRKTSGRTTVSAPVETAPVEPEPEQESLLRGFITFMEEFSVKKTIPVWAGALLAALIVVLGAGAYLFFSRER